jgi:hypothetical protein
MKLVENYFTKHHLLNAPHKWFLAFLCSPIHFLEQHYQKKYHVNFVHAKKLFVFDMALLGSIIALTGCIIFWLTYNPSITDKISLNIIASKNKIKSGEFIEYTLSYKNNSNMVLVSPNLAFSAPNGFIIEKIEPENAYNKQIKSFKLDDLPPGANGLTKISGYFYGTPEKNDNIKATLSFMQEKTKMFESKTAIMITTLRGSVLSANLSTQQSIASTGQFRFEINAQLEKNPHIDKIIIPLEFNEYMKVSEIEAVNSGTIENNSWVIKAQDFEKQQTALLRGYFSSNVPSELSKIQLEMKPQIFVQNSLYNQTTYTKDIDVLHPQVLVSSNWDKTTSAPEQTRTLTLLISNNGSFGINSAKIQIPIPTDVINYSALSQLNRASFKDNSIIITSSHVAGLKHIAPQQKISMEIKIPINKIIQKQDAILTLKPVITGALADNPDIQITASSETEKLRIGTNLLLGAELRYFTDDGDQLGRGPLPPTAGKETKYWAFINITNTTSNIKDFKFNAKIPSYVVWTGKSSISKGTNISYDENNRTISYASDNASPNETIGIYFELAITPSENQKDTSPVMLDDISISAFDSYINEAIYKTHKPLDISIPADARGKNKGTKVK